MTLASNYELLKVDEWSKKDLNILSDQKILKQEIQKTWANVEARWASKTYEELWEQHKSEMELFDSQLDIAKSNKKAEEILITARKDNLAQEAKKPSVINEINQINTFLKTNGAPIEQSLVASLVQIGKIKDTQLKDIAATLGLSQTTLEGLVETCNDCIPGSFDINAVKAVGKVQFFAKEQYIKEVAAAYKDGKKYGIDRSAGTATFATIRKILEAFSKLPAETGTQTTVETGTVNEEIVEESPAKKLYTQLMSWETVDLSEIDETVLQDTKALFVSELNKSWVTLDGVIKDNEKKEPIISLRKHAQAIVDELDKRSQTETPTLETENKETEKPATNSEVATDTITKALETVKITNPARIAEIKNTAELVYDATKDGDKNTWMGQFIQEAIDATKQWDLKWEERKKLIVDRIIEKWLADITYSMNTIKNENRTTKAIWYGADYKLDTRISNIVHAEEMELLLDKKEKLIRKKIETTNLKELFDIAADPQYFDHLALNLWEVRREGIKEEDAKYIAKYIILTDTNPTGSYRETPKEVTLEFDNTGKLLTKNITMPTLFGYERKYTMNDGGKFIESTKETRENLMKIQKDKIDEIIANTRPGSNLLNAKVDDIDIDGMYKVTFDIPAVYIKNLNKTVENIQDQTFFLKFSHTSPATITKETTKDQIGDPLIVESKRYITTGDADIQKKWILGKDRYGIYEISVKKTNDGKAYLDVNTTTTKEKPPTEEKKLAIDGIQDATPFYKKTANKKEETIDIIDASPADKYYTLVTLETKNKWETLKEPKKIDIVPLGNISGDEISETMKAFRETYKTLLTGLTLPTGAYKFSDAQIDTLIKEYNQPLHKAVYPIKNPKTKEIQYYTASKNWEKISFTEDQETLSFIRRQKEALKSRFDKILAIYNEEQIALNKVRNTAFEKNNINDGKYNLGLYEDKIVIQTRQKGNILSKEYDKTKIKYEAPIWYSKTEKTSPTPENSSSYEAKGVLYFDHKWAYDTANNMEYYTTNKEANKPTIEGKIGIFKPSTKWYIRFFDQSAKEKKSF